MSGEKQYAAEDRVVNIVAEAVKSQPAIQFTLTKALRVEAKKEGADRVALARPPCSQMMGVTLQAYSRADKSLSELFHELDRMESHKGEIVTKVDIPNEVYTQWKYLRHQIKTKKKTKLD
jgi:cell division protein FtsX